MNNRGPVNHCRVFMMDCGAVGELVPKEEFDRLARTGGFAVGPFRDTFGDGHGEPYNPERQAFGKLNDGRCVYAELVED
jgi:hypothetical protein